MLINTTSWRERRKDEDGDKFISSIYFGFFHCIVMVTEEGREANDCLNSIAIFNRVMDKGRLLIRWLNFAPNERQRREGGSE